MKRLQNHYFQQKILILLSPILLYTICSFALYSCAGTGYCNLLYILRELLPCVLAILITFILPLKERRIQVLATILSYGLLYYIFNIYLGRHNTTILILASASSMLIFLGNLDLKGLKNNLIYLSIALLIPLFVALSLYSIMQVIATVAAAVFVPGQVHEAIISLMVIVHMIMQAFTSHSELAPIMATQLSERQMIAVYNTIFLANFLILPTIIFVKSLFVQGALKIFLLFLGITVVLSASLGATTSIILCFMLFFFPGSFIILAVSALCLYFIGLNLAFPAMVTGGNLYLSNVDMAYINLLDIVSHAKILIFSAIILPTIFIGFTTILKLDHLKFKRQQKGNVNFNLGRDLKYYPDIQVIALLRALGGISNIRQLKALDSLLLIEVFDPNLVALTALSALSTSKTTFDRVKKSYSCDMGRNTHLVYERLTALSGDFLGRSGEIVMAEPFIITRPPPRYKD